MPGNKRLTRRNLIRLLAAAGAGGGSVALAAQVHDNGSSGCDHLAWVGDALKRMQTVMPGMARSQLLSVLTMEGGISTALQRTFVSRDCPYFKVDVTFRRAADHPADAGGTDWIHELDSDVIATISRPYLQFSIMD
jgi:hypothetical protein